MVPVPVPLRQKGAFHAVLYLVPQHWNAAQASLHPPAFISWYTSGIR
jgi:hypothetical protein